MKGEMLRKYRSAYDDKDFNRWLTTNAVIGAMFFAALTAMAIVAAVAPTPIQSADRIGKEMRHTERTSHPGRLVEDTVGSGHRAPPN